MTTNFLPNKYTKWYINIIAKARVKRRTGYLETHHIIPRSLGGDNSGSNLVDLTAREHYVCHLLLVRMLEGLDRRKMVAAAHCLINRRGPNKSEIVPNSRIYQKLKVEFSHVQRQNRLGKKHSDDVKQKIGLARTGIKHSEETKARLSLIASARTLSEDTKAKMSRSHTGAKRSEDMKRKMSEAQKLRWLLKKATSCDVSA